MGKEKKVIKWSQEAKNTLQHIYDYISLDSVTEAEKQILRIYDKVSLLETGYSKIGQRQGFNIHKLKIDYRYLVQDNYKIIYHEEKNEIRIDIVFDTRQNPQKLKKLIKG